MGKYCPVGGVANTSHVYTNYPSYEGVIWSIIHDRAEGDWAISGMIYARINSEVGTGEPPFLWNIIGRGIAQFDTRGLSEDIVTAKLGLYVASANNQFSTTIYLNVYSADPASPTIPEVGDYDCFGTTEFSTGKDLASLPTGGWVEFELNAAGIAAINKGGITALGLRLDRDAIDSPPTWGYNKDAIVIILGHNAANPIQKPYLWINYEPGYIWVSDELGEKTELHYLATDAERAIEGVDTGENGDPGYLWVEGTYLHYIDSLGDERRIEGTKEGATGTDSGYIWIDESKLRYIDGSGDERYLEGSLVAE